MAAITGGIASFLLQKEHPDSADTGDFADSSASREPAPLSLVDCSFSLALLHLHTLCSLQIMNTPLAMITAAPTKVNASGISFQNSQPSAVAQMMAV